MRIERDRSRPAVERRCAQPVAKRPSLERGLSVAVRSRMNRYPELLRTRLDANTAALLTRHADTRGTTPGELARELLGEALARLDGEPTTPLWLELFAIENCRLRAVVLRLLEEVGRTNGWTQEYLTGLLHTMRSNADEYARARLAEIEQLRQSAPRRRRR
jgi:hypothetical protein